MMIQRDSLTENMILQGRYEVRKAIHTTQVERDYEVYDREEKKEYRVKEFYPSNYCRQGGRRANSHRAWSTKPICL